MNEVKKLEIILNSLIDSYDLSVYNFADDTAIIKDIEKDLMFSCDVLFYDDKAFFISIKQKEANYLDLKDIA